MQNEKERKQTGDSTSFVSVLQGPRHSKVCSVPTRRLGGLTRPRDLGTPVMNLAIIYNFKKDPSNLLICQLRLAHVEQSHISICVLSKVSNLCLWVGMFGKIRPSYSAYSTQFLRRTGNKRRCSSFSTTTPRRSGRSRKRHADKRDPGVEGPGQEQATMLALACPGP